MAKKKLSILEKIDQLPTARNGHSVLDDMDPRQRKEFEIVLVELRKRPRSRRPRMEDLLALLKSDLGIEMAAPTLRRHLNGTALNR